MTNTLHYFDFDGSRGLECRLALTAAGVPYEDIRLNRAQWAEYKPSTPFGSMPVYTEGDHRIAQSCAILRYIGATHGLHPVDPWTAAEHDAIMQSVEDLRSKVPAGTGLSEEEKKAQREAFTAGFLTTWCRTVADRIQGPFLEGDALNVADLKVYTVLRAYMGGGYDHIPASVFDAYPKIVALYKAVDAHPAVRAYFATRPG